MTERFPSLEAVIRDERFPEVDTALRSGRHVAIDDLDWYEFLQEAQSQLEPHYRRWGLDLVQRNDGYYFLKPARDGVRRRKLSHAEMLTGQALALLWLDPATLAAQGVVRRSEVLRLLGNLVGEENLVTRLNPRRRRHDERLEQETIRQELQKATRQLADLGFCELVDEESVRVRPAILRFADLARGTDPREALERLVAGGEVVVEAEEDAPTDEVGP